MLDPVVQPQKSQAMLQACRKVAGKLCGKNGPSIVGQCSAKHELSVCPSGQDGFIQHPETLGKKKVRLYH